MKTQFSRALLGVLAAATFGLLLGVTPIFAQPSSDFTITAPPSISVAPDNIRAPAGGAGEAVSAPEAEPMARMPPPVAERTDCLTDRQLRRGLRAHEFDNIEIGRKLTGNMIEVMANYGGSLYRMKLDRCSGRVSDVVKMRRNGLGGFGLQFGF